MKLIGFLIFLLVCNGSQSQIFFDKNVKAKYDSILNNCDKELQAKANKMESLKDYSGAYVFYTFFKIDTLNNASITLKKSSEVVLTNLDGSSIKSTEKPFPFVDIDFCGVDFLKDDSVKIEIGYPFSHRSITHSINKNSLATTINLYYKHDSILKAKQSDSQFANDLTIKADALKFVLSDSTFTSDKYVYGFAEIESDDFYMQSLLDNNQILHLRYRMKYFFKIRKTKEV